MNRGLVDEGIAFMVVIVIVGLVGLGFLIGWAI